MDKTKTAIIHGIPGERARAAGVMRAVGPLLVALFACGLFTGLILPRVTWGVAGCGFLLASIFLIWGVKDGLRGIEAFFKGARGEERVAMALSGLPGEFHVFHDLACGCELQGIDHVVLGPTGFFVIETKYWAGRVTMEQGEIRVNNQCPSRSPLLQARQSADNVNRFLTKKVGISPTCLPLVCFAGNTFLPGVVSVEGLIVCNVSALPGLLLKQGGHISRDEIDRAAKVLEQKD